MAQRLIFTNDVNRELATIVERRHPSSVFLLTDENTHRMVRPLVDLAATDIIIPAGDEHKNIDSLQQVWRALQQGGATRQSLLINLGGGVVTDLGGLAAATFKRGMRFVNVPTTLLGAVDAAVGGKTGINFGGLKNEIGAFAEATDVVISTCFFSTLPTTELKSGFAEMLKHGLLTGSDEFDRLLHFDLDQLSPGQLLDRLQASVLVKQRIVEQDPHEQGLRRALNLGHTVGHAFESHALTCGHPVPHGYAVAWGLVTECVLSHMMMRFPSSTLQQLATFVRRHYGIFSITCDDYDTLLTLMRHDKKSRQGEINCTLLAACGDVRIDVTVTPDDMRTALDIYRDLMGI
ncbi:MAG: 3-dehydroquinate synthase [Muribaculaceae bacterium]|nr:3-dehydroquinate synthase [Muribaculaceae bacterium]